MTRLIKLDSLKFFCVQIIILGRGNIEATTTILMFSESVVNYLHFEYSNFSERALKVYKSLKQLLRSQSIQVKTAYIVLIK